MAVKHDMLSRDWSDKEFKDFVKNKMSEDEYKKALEGEYDLPDDWNLKGILQDSKYNTPEVNSKLDLNKVRQNPHFGELGTSFRFNLSNKQISDLLNGSDEDQKVGAQLYNQDANKSPILTELFKRNKQGDKFLESLNNLSDDHVQDYARDVLKMAQEGKKIDNAPVGKVLAALPQADAYKLVSKGSNYKTYYRFLPDDLKNRFNDEKLGITGGKHGQEIDDPEENFDNWDAGDGFDAGASEWIAKNGKLSDAQAEHIMRHGSLDARFNMFHDQDINPDIKLQMYNKWNDDDYSHGYDQDDYKEHHYDNKRDSDDGNDLWSEASERAEEEYPLGDFLRDQNSDVWDDAFEIGGRDAATQAIIDAEFDGDEESAYDSHRESLSDAESSHYHDLVRERYRDNALDHEDNIPRDLLDHPDHMNEPGYQSTHKGEPAKNIKNLNLFWSNQSNEAQTWNDNQFSKPYINFNHAQIHPDQIKAGLNSHAKFHQDKLLEDYYKGNPRDLEMKTFKGKQYIKLYRGVAGEYGQKIADKLGYDKSTHSIPNKNIDIPSAPFSSWTQDKHMATRFAAGRGGTQGGLPVVIEKWHPIEDVAHTGFYSQHIEMNPAHPDESEIIIKHPGLKSKIKSTDLHIGLPSDDMTVMYYWFPKTPVKTVTKTEVIEKIVEKEKIVYKQSSDKNTNTSENRNIETKTITRPDGTVETITTDKSTVQTTANEKTTTESTKETEKSQSKVAKATTTTVTQRDWMLGVSAHTDASNPSKIGKDSVTYQAEISRNILGPVYQLGFKKGSIVSENDVKVAVLETKLESLSMLTESKLDSISDKMDVLFDKIDRLQRDVNHQSHDVSKLMERDNFTQTATLKNTQEIQHLYERHEKLQKEANYAKGALGIIGIIFGALATSAWDIIKAFLK
ncbi:hypothetical protein DAPPUDRAFT_120457 [Daphnia pulex]|uniref:Uncharacterized protein n=1 Tax=Daphnia pulex TaxID=6669 RepID=E9I1F2_DAPPU|nr:hypothetical protein DAPPUDRAFT_120457 [Daphnia pulex]|eukprot:EFX62181.1 hypothetical protein DAPPUDRAFT_120457 [Daphnia pulex]